MKGANRKQRDVVRSSGFSDKFGAGLACEAFLDSMRPKCGSGDLQATRPILSFRFLLPDAACPSSSPGRPAFMPGLTVPVALSRYSGVSHGKGGCGLSSFLDSGTGCDSPGPRTCGRRAEQRKGRSSLQQGLWPRGSKDPAREMGTFPFLPRVPVAPA
jgi:hypothetical protein